MTKETMLNLMEDIISEDIEVMKEVVKEDLLPLIKHRQEIERKIFNREYEEQKRLEEEL